MDIEKQVTLAEKQAFWTEQLPNFESKYWLPNHFSFLEFAMEQGNYVIRDDLDPAYEEDANEIYHRVNTGWAMWKKAINFHRSPAVPEGRTDSEIIGQTIELVDLLASSNRFQRDKSKPFPFESKNPRSIEWWRLACQIQELLTDTDPNNCDFEEYKAIVKAQEPANE